MEREEIRNVVIGYFRQQLPLLNDPSRRPQIQMGTLYHLFDDSLRNIPSWQQVTRPTQPITPRQRIGHLQWR